MTESELDISEVGINIMTHGKPKPGVIMGGPGLENDNLPHLTPAKSKFYRLL
jgi:hypothetical protein